MEEKVRVYVALTMIFKREEDVWTAECKELGTATFGESFEEARDNLKEAVTLQLDTLEKLGERKRFFEEHGIEVFVEQPKKMYFPEMPFDSDMLISKEVESFNLGVSV
jgi:predicted RNase H-like HicB family nuclease